jgi:hypothetical protein
MKCENNPKFLHERDPFLLIGPERRAYAYILKPFTGNGDVSIWVKNSRAGRKKVNNILTNVAYL